MSDKDMPKYAPLRVTVVRDTENAAIFIGGIVQYLLRGAVVTVAAPVVTDGAWAPGYWMSVLAALGATYLLGFTSDFTWWTQSKKALR